MNIKKTTARLADLLKPGTLLSQRVARGGIWVFATRIANRLFRLISTVILAGILAPSDFGLFGIALLSMSALETFSQAGLRLALVQKEEDIAPYLDTVWTFQAMRGILLTLLLVALAPYVAAFFEAPATTPILRVIAISPLILGFTNVGVIYFDKELEFQKQFAYQFSGTLANVCVAVASVYILRSVWALVFGLLAGNLALLAMSYFFHPYRPRLRFNQKQFKELFTFGKWILGSSMLVFITYQGDNIFVGKLLGTAFLGLYQLAYQIATIPATEITHVISSVTFPAYSKLQADLPNLREAYLKVLRFTSFLSLPMAGLIFALAPDFTTIFLGDNWMPMIPIIQILVFSGLLISLAATTGPLFMAIGRPRISTKLQLVRVLLLLILIYPFAVRWGIQGISLAVVFAVLIPFAYAFYKVSYILSIGMYNI